MAWVTLLLAGILEAVWATALGKSHGFTRLTPSLIFVAALALSMLGLAHATRTLPASTAYAVWVGIGASLTVAYAMITGAEPASGLKIAFVAGIVVCVTGLHLVSQA